MEDGRGKGVLSGRNVPRLRRGATSLSLTGSGGGFGGEFGRRASSSRRVGGRDTAGNDSVESISSEDGEVRSRLRRWSMGRLKAEDGKKGEGKGDTVECGRCREMEEKVMAMKEVIRMQSEQLAVKRAEVAFARSITRKKTVSGWFGSNREAEITLLRQEIEKLQMTNEFLYQELQTSKSLS